MALGVSLLLGVVAAAAGQPASRVELGPVVRHDHVFIEGGAGGGIPVAGVVTRVRLSRRYGVEAELTQAWQRIARSYEGWFISYAEGPDLTPEEIERLAPIVRRSLGYVPGVGAAAAFVARGDITPRVSLAGRVGVSARRYVETSASTILSIPEGIRPDRVASDFPDTSRRRTRGGLLLGLDVAVAVTPRLSLAPEIRVVYGGPARIGDKHRELGVGARATWRFW